MLTKYGHYRRAHTDLPVVPCDLPSGTAMLCQPQVYVWRLGETCADEAVPVYKIKNGFRKWDQVRASVANLRFASASPVQGHDRVGLAP
eukprot:6602061-Pyramimonas_sp.AAC.1